jgi:hypothetical protein
MILDAGSNEKYDFIVCCRQFKEKCNIFFFSTWPYWDLMYFTLYIISPFLR